MSAYFLNASFFKYFVTIVSKSTVTFLNGIAIDLNTFFVSLEVGIILIQFSM